MPGIRTESARLKNSETQRTEATEYLHGRKRHKEFKYDIPSGEEIAFAGTD